jgi:hypothetical protein
VANKRNNRKYNLPTNVTGHTTNSHQQLRRHEFADGGGAAEGDKPGLDVISK